MTERQRSSRIYVVTDRALIRRSLETQVKWVRAATLTGALRAVADELFEVRAANADEVYLALSRGAEVLDATAAVPAEPEPDAPYVTDAHDPGPVPASVPK